MKCTPFKMFALVALAAAASAAPDPNCDTGIRAARRNDICCASSCGSCGGAGCGDRPGGGGNCCVGTIESSARSCLDHPPPCVVTEPTPPPTCPPSAHTGQWPFPAEDDDNKKGCCRFDGCSYDTEIGSWSESTARSRADCKRSCVRFNNAADRSVVGPICRAYEWDKDHTRCELHSAIPTHADNDGIRCRRAVCRVNPAEDCEAASPIRMEATAGDVTANPTATTSGSAAVTAGVVLVVIAIMSIILTVVRRRARNTASSKAAAIQVISLSAPGPGPEAADLQWDDEDLNGTEL